MLSGRTSALTLGATAGALPRLIHAQSNAAWMSRQNVSAERPTVVGMEN